MNAKKLILSAIQKHTCKPFVQCSGNHANCYELPSDIFTRACLITIKQRGVSVEDNGIAPT